MEIISSVVDRSFRSPVAIRGTEEGPTRIGRAKTRLISGVVIFRDIYFLFSEIKKRSTILETTISWIHLIDSKGFLTLQTLCAYSHPR